MRRCFGCQAPEVGPAPHHFPYAKGPILFFKRKATEPELKPCPQCGARIAASALDCPSCGLDLREAYHPAPDYARKPISGFGR